MSTTQRHSRKREAIREALMRTDDHPSAEMLYERLKPDFPDLSLGTVYRNLSLFRQEGAAVCVVNVKGQERFDADTTPHAHFFCERCGRVIDVTSFPSDFAAWSLPGQPRGVSLVIYGVCNHCE